MYARSAATLALATVFLLASGCKRTSDHTLEYRNAIDTYLATNQSCLWPQPQKLPVQLATSSDQTGAFDALYNQGLLVRTTAEKKQLLGLIDKQVTNYDLSPQGKRSWIASQTDPSTGNFCYGHRVITAIDSSTATGDQPGATASVAYHYTFTAVPPWARDGGIQNAFPNVQRNLLGGIATATLQDSQNGWIVQAHAVHSTSNADGSIVQ